MTPVRLPPKAANSNASGMANISLGRVTTLLLFGRAAGCTFSLLNSVILARTLGVDRLGAYAYAMGLAGVFGLIPNLGIGTIITRTIARNPDAGAGILVTAVRTQTLLAAGILLLIPAVAAVLPEQPVPLWYVGLAAAQLGIGTLSWPYLAVLAGRARYDRVAMAELLSGLAGFATIGATAALGGGVAAFLWAHVLAAGISVVAANTIAKPLLPIRKEPAMPFCALLRNAAPLGATAAVQSLYTRLDLVMLGQMASTAALGLYNAAYKPVTLAVYFGATVAGTLLPLMARETPREVPTALVRAMRGLGVAGPGLALAFSGLAAPMLNFLFGAEYVAAAPILIVLAWSTVANWVYAPLGISLQARGYERWWLASLIAGTIVNAAGNLWAIPRWGGLGAAGATLVSEFVLLGCGAVLAVRVLGAVPSRHHILVGLGATAAGGIVCAVLSSIGAVLATVAGLATYGLLLHFFRIVTAEDVTIIRNWLRDAVVGWSKA